MGANNKLSSTVAWEELESDPNIVVAEVASDYIEKLQLIPSATDTPSN